MTIAGLETKQFHAHRFSINRSMDRLEMLALGAGSIVALGLCFIPNTMVRVLAAIVGSIMVARLAVGLMRRKKHSAWPVWLDADAISTLDEERIYTQTRWLDVHQACVVKSEYGNAPYELRLELRSHDITVYSIPGPADEPFHASLKGFLGSRLSQDVVSTADLPTSSIEMILKARELAKRVGDEYLRKCKGTTRSRVGSALNADVPLVVSPEEEREFLTYHPSIAQIESLIRAAIRLEEQDLGPNSAYNVANGYNQLGTHYLSIQDFDQAIEAMKTALKKLFELWASNLRNLDVVKEIATAHFNLGDAYATLYRRSGSAVDRESARRHYQESMASDRSQQADCRRTEQRLKSL